MIGIVSFSLKMPNPWMAIAVAAPYVIIVLIVNYTDKKGIWFEILALVALYKGNIKKILRFGLYGGTLTALFILLFGLFYPLSRPLLKYITISTVSVLLFFVFTRSQ